VLEAIAKADTLIEAMGWIRRFRGKKTVIKLGGSLMDQPEALHHLLLDVIFMESVGMFPIIVHGGGKAINRAVSDAGITPQFIRGRRYTDPPTLEIVKRVLAQEVNGQLVDAIERLGGRAVGLNFDSDCVLSGQLLKLDEETGEPIDLGLVGEVTRVDCTVIDAFCYTNQVPVIPSMCLDANGSPLNVNADTAAMAVAEALGAEKLVFLSDIPGVCTDPRDPETRIASLSAERAQELIRTGVITGGMIPKVEACLATLQRGVGKVHIVDGRLRHSLLLEIYTTSGVGTEIVRHHGPPSASPAIASIPSS
jgi:acetylglutamate kinase